MSSDPVTRSNEAVVRAPAIRSAHYALGIFGYLAMALALTFPVVTDPATLLISQWPSDADHVLWTQWWFARAIESPDLSLFQTDLIRYPDLTNLQFADINLAINALAYVVAKPLGLIAAYNAMLWLSFVVSGGLMWELGRRVGGDALAGWLAGLVFAGSTYWLSCALNSWAYLVHIWVFPLAFLALERALQVRADGRYRIWDFVVLAAAIGGVFHVTPIYFLFLGVLALALLPVYGRRVAALARAPGGPVCIAIAVAIVCGIVLPRAIPMVQASRADYAVHSSATPTILSSTPLEFVWPWVERPDRPANATFAVVFVGFTVPLVIAWGWWRSRRRRDYAGWLAAAAAMFVLALGPVWQTDSGASIRLPAHWLLQLPGFSFLTNHWRWSLPGSFCLAVAFSLALSDLFKAAWFETAPARRTALAAGVAIAFALELALVFPFPWPRPIWSRPPDPISHELRSIESIHTVLDFRRRAKLHQMIHEKRIVGGWLPRVELRSVEATRELMAGVRANTSADYLGQHGIDAVVVDDRTAFRIAPVRGRPGAFRQVPLPAPSAGETRNGAHRE